jgi:hypothetical protein
VNAVEIISHCRNSNIALAVDAEGKLHVSGNKDGIATLREDIKAHKAELVAILQAPVTLDLTREGPRQEALTTGKRGDAVLGASDLEASQGGAAATPTHGRAADVSTPVKHTRRRALASTPPPHTGPLTDGHYAFLYSVLKDGRVERGTFISKDLKTEPEAYAFLRKRFPSLTVQWARVIQHPVCGGCQHFTGGVLCNADQSPDYAASVGSCGKYGRAGEL